MTDEKRLFKAINSNRKEEPEATFNYIYIKYKPLVTFIVAQYIKNSADIEDIVQDSFVEFFNDVKNIKTTIKSYLTTCSKHNALDFLKKNKKISYVDIETLDNLFIDNSIEELKLFAHENFVDLLNDMKKYLTKEDITIILLHLAYDNKFEDIALKLNQNVKTIKTKYYRSLKKYKNMKGVK